MELLLKNIKHHAAMDQETTCFTATLYCGKRRIGTVRNDGHGGETTCQIESTVDDLQALSDKAVALVICSAWPTETLLLDTAGDPTERHHVAQWLATAADILFDEWDAAKAKTKMTTWLAKQVALHATQGFPLTVVCEREGKITLCPIRTSDELPRALQRLKATEEQVAIVGGA